ncbi:protein FAM185A [Triplophysa dalaica]|uniref:protein FAM185A n=1 Tax=Triplophysa dalaica TaxID=1582913 RepID=UPI0024DFCEF3|nr:protein FAM185A [Triplophysa dalaica]
MLICAIQHRLRHCVRMGSAQRCSRHFKRALTSPAFRLFSYSPSVNTPVKQWDLSVNPFTKIKCHLGCNISIKPLDPHVFPEADRAFIDVRATNRDLDLDTFHVHYDPRSNELQIVSHDENNSDVSVELTAPIKCDLHIKTKNKGNVKIQRMESDLCHLHTEKGHCILQAVKGHEILVHSTGGNVTGLNTIHGNVEIRAAGDSNVDIMKIQGTTMNLSTVHGMLKVKAIYAESTTVSTSSGNVQIGHIHGEADIQSETGNVVIDSSSGSLKVLTAAGNIDAYVGHDGTAELHAYQGTVSVRVPSTIKTGVQLCGTSVDISSEIACQETEHTSSDGKAAVTAHMNGDMYEERWIKATADKGPVSLKSQSWFETLRLGAEN